MNAIWVKTALALLLFALFLVGCEKSPPTDESLKRAGEKSLEWHVAYDRKSSPTADVLGYVVKVKVTRSNDVNKPYDGEVDAVVKKQDRGSTSYANYKFVFVWNGSDWERDRTRGKTDAVSRLLGAG